MHSKLSKSGSRINFETLLAKFRSNSAPIILFSHVDWREPCSASAGGGGGGNSQIKVTWEKGHLLERTTYQCPLRPLLKGSSNSESTPTVAKQQHCTKNNRPLLSSCSDKYMYHTSSTLSNKAIWLKSYLHWIFATSKYKTVLFPNTGVIFQ